MLTPKEVSELLADTEPPKPAKFSSSYFDYQCAAQAGVEERRRIREEMELYAREIGGAIGADGNVYSDADPGL